MKQSLIFLQKMFPGYDNFLVKYGMMPGLVPDKGLRLLPGFLVNSSYSNNGNFILKQQLKTK